MGILFTILMGFLLTITVGILITIGVGIQLTISIISVLKKGGSVKACGTCAETRGIKNINPIDGIKISTMSQLAHWVVNSDRILTF